MLTQWKEIAGLFLLFVGVVTAIWRALRPASDDAVVDSMRRRSAVIKQWMESPEMFAREIQQRHDIASMVDRNADTLRAVSASLAAQTALIEKVGSLANSVEHLGRAVAEMSKDLREQRRDGEVIGKDVANLRGMMESWDGEEKRHGRGRRVDDQQTHR